MMSEAMPDAVKPNASRDHEGAVKTRSFPLAYLITFTCYGARLHGDAAGSVDRRHNLAGSDFLPPNPPWHTAEQEQMKQNLYELGAPQRTLVLQSLHAVCAHRKWMLLAAHVRVSHVHTVIAARVAPEKVLGDIKAYASRALNRAGGEALNRLRWSRHGSTRYLWKPEDVGAAMEYVVHRQGAPLAVWENPNLPSW